MLRRQKAETTEEPLPRRVLVVDPDEGSCELWARALETTGHPVDRLVGDGVLSVLHATPFGCVVLNASAPGEASRGMRLVDSIRHDDERQARRVGIVLVLPNAKNRIFAWESGIDDLLVIPVDVDTLVTRVRGVLERSRSERIAHREAQLQAARRA